MVDRTRACVVNSRALSTRFCVRVLSIYIRDFRAMNFNDHHSRPPPLSRRTVSTTFQTDLPNAAYTLYKHTMQKVNNLISMIYHLLREFYDEGFSDTITFTKAFVYAVVNY